MLRHFRLAKQALARYRLHDAEGRRLEQELAKSEKGYYEDEHGWGVRR